MPRQPHDEGVDFMSTNLIQGDRRQSRRYDCQLDLRFEQQSPDGAVRLGCGTTADLSSGGLRFYSDEPLEAGAETVTRVAWPFKLQNVCPLELILTGRISTVTARGAILAIRSYEFRTCGAKSFWEPEPASSISKVA